MKAWISQALKAFYAAVVACLTGLSTILVDGQSISDVSTGQWVAIALGTVVAFGAVFGVTNATK